VYVTGPKGVVTVRIVDLCPECKAGHLDLSREAFAQIADLTQGRVPITWQVVSPALAGPIAYHFKDGSNQWWTARLNFRWGPKVACLAEIARRGEGLRSAQRRMAALRRLPADRAALNLSRSCGHH
jgi:hypothetical protein